MRPNLEVDRTPPGGPGHCELLVGAGLPYSLGVGTSADSAANIVRFCAITLAAAVSLLGCAQIPGPHVEYLFNEAEIRDAERALVNALESDNPTAWVYHYTEDAVFVVPGAPAE